MTVLNLDRKMASDASHFLTLQAYLQQQGVKIDRTLSTVTVSFPSKVAAEEFERLMKQMRRGA